MGQSITFFVPGIPQSRGSKQAFPFRRKNGSLGVAVSDDNPKSKDWMASVAQMASEAIRGFPLQGPVGVRMTFVMPRPKHHFGTGRNAHVLKDSAPRYHSARPDRGKLQRAVEDALTGIGYLDDAQICCGPVEKIYGQRPGVEIAITAMSSEQFEPW